ncbi:MAG TPA: hypothetical protein VGN42_19465 [Pirellulales bacterium]|nr:hypothetical protein [Pirellulales bacterium]
MTLQVASLGILTFAVLASIVYERGMARAFWIGVAVVGWGNLGWQTIHFSELSVTGEISERLMEAIHSEDPPVPPAAGPSQAAATTMNPYDADPAPSPPSSYDRANAKALFPYIAVWIWPLLLGFVGGMVAQQLYLRRERLAAKLSPHGSGPIS